MRFAVLVRSNLQMKMQLAEAALTDGSQFDMAASLQRLFPIVFQAAGNKMEAAKYRDKLDDYWVKREKEEKAVQEMKDDLSKQEAFINKLPAVSWLQSFLINLRIFSID